MHDEIASRFPLPDQDAFTAPPQPLRPADLPLAHPGLAAGRAFDWLWRLNRLRLPAGPRLQALEQVAPALQALLGTLQERLHRATGTPLAGRRMEAALGTVRLHQELALGYRAVLGPAPLPGDGPSGAGLALVLHRTMHHLCQVVRLRVLMGEEAEPEVWARIYAVYALAQGRGALAEATAPLPGEPAESVDGAFKKAVLLAVSAPRSLRSEALETLCRLLPELAPYARLRPVREAPAAGPAFLVALYNGTAPAIDPRSSCRSCGHADHCLELDLSDLLPELRRRRERPGLGADDPERQVLDLLEGQLGPRRKRRGRRVQATHEVEVIAGLGDIHRALSGADGATPPRLGSGGTRPRRRLELEHIEIPAHFRPGERPRAFTAGAAGPRRTWCTTLNFSSGGYCLATAAEDPFRVQVQELVAVRDGRAGRWLLGAVSWVGQPGAEGRQFGVRLFGPRCAAGQATRAGEEGGRVEPCLVLLDREGAPPTRLVLSPRALEVGAAVGLRLGTEAFDLVLTRERGRTPGYVEYRCKPPRAADADEDRDSTTLLVDTEPVDPPRSVTVAAPGEGRGDWPWKRLELP